MNADRPAADAAFKPKCLGIASSIQICAALRRASFPAAIRTRRRDSIKALRLIARNVQSEPYYSGGRECNIVDRVHR
ncbi:hypothetical protein ABIF38_005666 [Bradyrhizobium japonicum]|uniref:Uncharacterized protein n=1 Tax=Bradyrhizobium elkanii TaxID=29448 RepID=A0A7Y8R217_BRAEL|nr:MULTISPECIES: hypothetical protein [Bradyrhizobium]MBP1296303.1 hypothetical protein [Bradyrhizobium elkanii]MBP2434737.1 hypothetical protein [Bradyrhizobium elkanii]MCP1732024.1 hypothetical protein [Bradyrhizobium elkanii]MCP1749690.1 hypothetical protein [Bradyrhizobium elkanii]MCP1932798.1 hypothetical protein [Bradyrhizobium elkanii]